MIYEKVSSMPKYLLSMFYNPNVKLKILAGLTLLDKELGNAYCY
ncbi:ribonucleoside-diphosphate reductase beta subunit [Bacillus spizizenii TU-B-10]|uniref:Ribonucleoside-diphosphate reductase beta subunit n=1 Tax=Bacillus spizizenii (strain DSM 15029 / JCM 12233 / NBRC 101239 / NRRL B-23049 / TU-B-10) TaxID=1052585 RepID=G4NVS3_BACS4|nr:ribonucleoside-diphosphate reductase beta subunit [Bacillus spizizenii TU-B-10]